MSNTYIDMYVDGVMKKTISNVGCKM
jgi:hypothetical protein